jgi:hypothetical protein
MARRSKFRFDFSQVDVVSWLIVLGLIVVIILSAITLNKVDKEKFKTKSSMKLGCPQLGCQDECQGAWWHNPQALGPDGNSCASCLAGGWENTEGGCPELDCPALSDGSSIARNISQNLSASNYCDAYNQLKQSSLCGKSPVTMQWWNQGAQALGCQ